MKKLYEIFPDGIVIINGTKTNLNKLKCMADNWTLKDMTDKFGVAVRTMENCLCDCGIEKRYVRYMTEKQMMER